jgi:hypothetical protein
MFWGKRSKLSISSLGHQFSVKGRGKRWGGPIHTHWPKSFESFLEIRIAVH